MNLTELNLSQWIPRVQGQYINIDNAAGAQCWDLAADWSQYLGLPVISTWGSGRWPGWAGNMVDAFPQNPAIAGAYDLLPPTAAAQGGDIAVWGDSYWYYPKTHVAVVVRDGGLLTCMSQNSTPSRWDNPYLDWTTGPTTLQALPKQGLIGYIRPRLGLTVQGALTPPEEDFMATWSHEDKVNHFNALTRIDNGTAALLATNIGALPDAQYWKDNINAVGRLDEAAAQAPGKQYWNDLIGAMARVDADAATDSDPKALAAAIAAALPPSDANALLDALAERLAK